VGCVCWRRLALAVTPKQKVHFDPFVFGQHADPTIFLVRKI
jgi:hypothetical protein